MVPYLGDFAEDATVYIPFNTFSSDDPAASVTVTDLVASDIYVYKDGSTTSITTDGASIDVDFTAGGTGAHLITIDTSADAAYATGSDYLVRIEGATVDGGTINSFIAQFSIENRFNEVNVTQVGGQSATATGAVDFDDVATILADTGELQTNQSNWLTATGFSTHSAADVWAAGTRALTTASNITSDGSAITMSAAGVVSTVNTVNTATTVTNEVTADVVKISGSAASADNLELQYNGTGITGGNYPSTQSQVGGIGASSGGSLNYEVTGDNTGGAIKSATFVGIQTLTFAETEAEDASYHQIDHAGNTIDIVYQVDIGGNRTGSEVTFKGYLTGSNDALNIQAYDFIGGQYETRAVLTGQAGTDNLTQTVPLLSKHTGTSGADIGLINIRFVGTAQTAPILFVDELLVAGVPLSQTVGYSAGEIWVDTVNGAAGNEAFVNGVADNPVSTWADALTLSGTLGINRFRLVGATSIALTGNSDSYTIVGDGTATVTLSGQSVSGAVISGCILDGNDDGSNTVRAIYRDCTIGTQSFGLHRLENCGLSGTVTLAEAGTFDWINCHSRVAGTGTPAVNVGTAVANTNLNMRNYSGGIEVQEFGDTGTDTMSLEGQGQLVINANCSGGTIAIRGAFTVTDNAAGAVTLSDDARIDMAQVNAECDTALSDYDPPTNAELEARTLVAANYFDPAADTVANVTTVANNTDMRGTDNAALASVATEARLAELDAGNLPADVDTLKTRITSTLFAGITSLAEWLGLLAGSQAADATALTEIKATGAGSGTYDESTDSQEAIAGAGGGGAPTVVQIREEMDSNSTQLAAIVEDTGTTLPAENAAAKENIDWALTVLVGALSNAGTATETYTFTVDGTAYTVTYAGLDEDGNRGTTVLSKV